MHEAPITPPDFLKDLNAAQRAAVEHTDGPTLIVAGAGSGKTRVLTYRIAYLLATRKADAFQVLSLTFTNKAAREMRARLERIVGPQARNLTMGTFHSVFARILRVEGPQLGYTSDFTIYDEDDAQSLVKNILKDLRIDDKVHKPRNIRHHISSAKNALVSPEQYKQHYVNDEFSHVAAQVYALYNQRLLKANAMDFDDLLVNMVELFARVPGALHKYQHRYKYVLVDEYQDTNQAQYIILKKLAAVHENLCVVGDDAQSIYSFRGANIQNILNFKTDYPDLRIFKLEQNYRSTGTIVQAANSVIAQNKYQIPKNVFTQNEPGELIHVLAGLTEQDESARVIDRIRELKMTKNLFNKDFAILYRTNAQSRVLEDELRRAGIFYRIYGGLSFYKRKEIKDVVAYLRLAVNPNDEEALWRVVNYPTRGIGQTTQEKIQVLADQTKLPPFEIVANSRTYAVSRATTVLDEFATMIQSFGVVARSQNAYEAVDHIAKASGILKELHRENTTESLSRYENVQELINAAKQFIERPAVPDPTDTQGAIPTEPDRSLSAFLQEISLYTDQDSENPEHDDYVTLMTIHAAKGLEFKAVFVVGLEENLFPNQLSAQSREDLEEERRLFYVAITRAERFLTLSHARSRFKFGNLQQNDVSRFIEEIDPRFLRATGRPAQMVTQPDTLTRILRAPAGTGSAPGKPAVTPPARPVQGRPAAVPPTVVEHPFEGDDPEKLQEGQRVQHAKFGIGRIHKLEGKGPDLRAHVDFDGKGLKTLLLKYAKLKILEG